LSERNEGERIRSLDRHFRKRGGRLDAHNDNDGGRGPKKAEAEKEDVSRDANMSLLFKNDLQDKSLCDVKQHHLIRCRV
jgi:hypothetical protein